MGVDAWMCACLCLVCLKIDLVGLEGEDGVV